MFVVSGAYLRTPVPCVQRPPVASRERSPLDCQTAVVRTLATVARFTGIAAAVVVGLGLILLAVTFGDCSAFGGRCPADPPPPLEDDVFGMAAVGGALLVGVPVLLTAPSWRRLGVAAVAALGAGLLIGMLARSLAHT